MSDQGRKFTGDELVIATHNKGKVPEIGRLLEGRVKTLYSAAELDLPEPEETEDSFVGNALLKARDAARHSGKPSLADDSGICVTALDGQPGIYSARWAGEPRDFMRAMERVQQELGDTPDRSAHFTCALALVWPDGHEEVVEGYVHGEMIWPPRGDKGFGYDPVFVPTGHDITFAEMDPDAKHAMSHRADAFAKLVKRCF
ncbi:MAG: RdgB/HAM1 family non-canonical purine NTP pyrophosphatase [Alphaproteobacteria bacterium]